jgi:hypothetical protein
MTRTISGYNIAARMGKAAAMKYCREWQAELTKLGLALASDLSSRKIDTKMYNLRRENLNKQTKDLNECIQSINRQFG